MDENAYEREVTMAPLFVASFALDPCLVVTGDQLQIAPFTKATVVENPFRPQLELSFMARQINIGMDYVMLREQYRMTDDIVHIPNKLTYENQLISSPSVSIENRPKARKFRQFALNMLGQDTNCFLVNLSPSEKNVTWKDDDWRSKGNDLFVCAIAELVESLLQSFKDTASIAILSAYKYQCTNYASLLGRMRELKLANHEMVTAQSFVGAQGRQYDIVIVELLVDGNVGFLDNEKQLNVAMSRARDGVIVVCDKLAVERVVRRSRIGQKKPAQYLHNVVDFLTDRTLTRPMQDGYPTTCYYTPKS